MKVTTRLTSLDKALTDPKLLNLGSATWQTWRSVLQSRPCRAADAR